MTRKGKSVWSFSRDLSDRPVLRRCLPFAAILISTTMCGASGDSPCDSLYETLPSYAARPPVPVGGYEQLANVITYPKLWAKAGIQTIMEFELDVSADSSARVTRKSGKGALSEQAESIVRSIESLKWIWCPTPKPQHWTTDRPAPFPIVFVLTYGDSKVSESSPLPGGGILVVSHRPSMFRESVPDAGSTVTRSEK